MSVLHLASELHLEVFSYLSQDSLKDSSTLLICKQLHDPAREGFYRFVHARGWDHIKGLFLTLGNRPDLAEHILSLTAHFSHSWGCLSWDCSLSTRGHPPLDLFPPYLPSCQVLDIDPVDRDHYVSTHMPLRTLYLWIAQFPTLKSLILPNVSSMLDPAQQFGHHGERYSSGTMPTRHRLWQLRKSPWSSLGNMSNLGCRSHPPALIFAVPRCMGDGGVCRPGPSNGTAGDRGHLERHKRQ